MTTFRKCMGVLIGMLCVLTAGGALALTQREWDLSCSRKTAEACTVYQFLQEETLPISEENGTAVDTLPAGTYVQINQRIGNGWSSILYFKDGVQKMGAVHVRFVTTESDVRGGDGMLTTVHELDDDYDAKMRQGTVEYDVKTGYTTYTHFDPSAPFYTPEDQIVGGALGQETPDTLGQTAAPVKKNDASRQVASTKKSTVASAKPASRQKPSPKAEMELNGETVQVEVVRIGTLETVIRRRGRQETVPTASLRFASEVPAEQTLAVVYAPRTGQATLRATASKTGRIIKNCNAGQLVAVIAPGKTYTRVNANGKIGYLLTAALRFVPAGDSVLGEGVLSVNGKATGSQMVNIRSEADKDSVKVDEWRTGTKVPVFDEKDGWYEVEHGGKRGWVMADYLTLP